MENEVLGLGQRTGETILNSAWQEDEVKLVTDAGLTVDEMAEHFVLSRGVDTLNAAIGTVLNEKANGTTPSRPVGQTEEEVNAEVHAGLQGITDAEKPEHVSDLIPPVQTNE